MRIILYVLATVLILLVLSTVVGRIELRRKTSDEIIKLFESARESKGEVITEEDVKGLPEPVQRYLRVTGVLGKEKIRTVRLKQKGTLRQNIGRKWVPFKAEQYYATHPPGFIWVGNVKAAKLFSVTAIDKYLEGKGSMIIKFLSLIKVAEARGEEIDEANLMRYLNEIMWFPPAYLNENIKWESINGNCAKATISDKGKTVSALLYFNEKGEIENFVAKRLCSVTGAKETWSTPIYEYKEVNGIRVPAKGEAIWRLSSGDFSYLRLDSIDIQYDDLSMY